MGLELRGAKGKIFGFARLEYHWADYYGKGDWNLKDNFQHPVSFTHDAQGIGTVISLGAGYILSRDWSLQLRADVENWDTDYGTDRTYFSSGATSDTRLNVVNWESLAIMLGATYRFSR
jgi:outer membrane protein W